MLRETRRLEAISGFPMKAIMAVLDYFKYCELGAVSPDYPYLAVGDRNAAKWADTMHYTLTGQMLHAGVRQVKLLSDDRQLKSLAWLLGYAAHVTTDVTIHPVVELKVGPYHGHEKEHRICEMNQDAFIFQRMNLGGIGLSEHLDSGIAECCQSTNKLAIDTDIKAVWTGMMREVHPADFSGNPPDVDKWHKSFKQMVDVVEEGNKLWPFARHVAAGQGLTYPDPDEVDKQFIEKIAVPGGRESYDKVFNLAIDNVAEVWKMIASGVFNNSSDHITKITAWNLDTGRNEHEKLVFWG
jgi:hypothetical protein